jgi:hypothetical protein
VTEREVGPSIHSHLLNTARFSNRISSVYFAVELNKLRYIRRVTGKTDETSKDIHLKISHSVRALSISGGSGSGGGEPLGTLQCLEGTKLVVVWRQVCFSSLRGLGLSSL